MSRMNIMNVSCWGSLSYSISSSCWICLIGWKGHMVIRDASLVDCGLIDKVLNHWQCIV